MSQGREQIIEARDVRDSQSIRDSQTSQFQGSQSQSARDSQSRTSIPIPEEDNPNYRSRWERTSFIGMLHFTHIIPFFRRVRAKIKKNHEITLDDAPRLGKTERVEYFDDRLYENYQSQRKSRPNKPASIVRAIIKTFAKEVVFQFIYQALFFGLRLVYGYFLHELLMALNDGSTSVREGYRKAIGLFVSLVVSMYASQQAYFNNYNLVTKTKAAVISLIYKKINKVSLYSLNQLSMGKIINIVANDINSFDKFFNIFALCLMPFVFGGGIAILCTFYGAVCLTGFAFIFLTFPLQMKLAKSSSPARKEKNRLTDERVKFTNEIIESIRLLKMYAWELAFKQRVEDIRENEIKILRRLAYTEGAQRVLAFSAISGSSFIIFLSYVLTGGTLNVGLVFSTVFLMQVVAMYGVFIPAIGIAFLIESKLTFKRIEQIFDLPEIKVFKHKAPVDPDNAVEYRKFSGYWDVPDGDTLNQQIKNQLVMQARASKSVEEAREALKQVRMASAQSLDLQDKPQRDIIEDKGVLDEKHIRKPPLIKKTETHVEKAVLKDINLDIKAKSLTAIVGRVGSGKSTLLLSLTGEMPRLEGSIRFSGKIAYVEQEPIIFSGTIRENITFGLEYEPDFYSQVVRASSLLSDFRQFPLKDLTEIGEKGITLSGGQKARVALARALYSRADIYLLDDPLSAVDTKVAKRLYEDAIRKFLRDKTVLLATHQVHFVRDAEKIIIMDEGEILASGTYDELQQGGFQLEAIAEEVKEAVPQHQVHKPEDHVELEEEAMTNDRQDEANLIHEEGGLFGKEDVESGRVSWATYKRFLKLSLTRYRGTLLFVLLIGTEILNIAYGRIIGLWGQGELERDVALGVAGGLALAAYIFFFTKIVLYTQATLRGSKKLHNGMLSVIIRNKVEFFDTNPVGRILNRFSHDVGIMDRMLPQYLLDILEGNTYLLALFIAIWAINPWVIFTGVATIIGFFFVIKITTPVVVHSRQLELISRSPLYSFFSMTLCGLIAVRSFGQSDNFMKKFTGMVNIFLKTNFAFWHASRFMSMLIDYTSSLGALAGLCIIIGTKNSKEPDLIGQSALYILLLNEQIQWILRQTINVNLFMASAARIIDYTDNTKVEAPLELPSDAELIRAGWPQQGQIDFDHVYMKYRQNTEHVVKDLTFKVKPGEKIGCVGRTGAGKSSILQILFRMVEIDKTLEGVETKLDIDQKDVANIGLHTLRKNISIIPQTPVLFTGTIRRNLDPFGVKTDEELWTALNEVNLKEHVEKLEGKMETDLTNANQTFSVGQKQLICLARAILKRSKIIVLDEATANVDFETDHFIQAKIMEKFNDCTVFTIAHRLSTIANYDKVLVMDKGRLAEFDAPYRLLVEKEGDNQITKENGVFASMVQNTGETASRHIFEVAKEKFASQQPEGMIPTEITIRNKSS